jgi:hypothetical protein
MIPLFMMFAGGPLGTGRQWLLLSLLLQTYSIRWDPSYSVSRQMDLIVSTFNFGIWLIARFSWIHLDDLVNLIYESLTNPTYKGDLTCTAHPLIPFSSVTG